MLLGSNPHNQIECCLLQPPDEGDYNSWSWGQPEQYEPVHTQGSEPIYQAPSPPQLTEYAPTVLIEQSGRPGTVVLGHSAEVEPPRAYVKTELPSNISQSQPASEPSTAASNSPTENQTSPAVQLEPFFESYNYDSFDAFSAPNYQGNNVQQVVPAGDSTPNEFTTTGTDWSTPPTDRTDSTTTPQGGEMYMPLDPCYEYNAWGSDMSADKRRRRFKEEVRDLGGGLGSPKEGKRRLGQSTKTTMQSSGSSGSDGGVQKNGTGGVACCRGVYFDQIRHLWRANWPEESVIIDKATQRMVDIRRCTRTKGFSAKKYGYQEAQRLAIEHREKMTGPGMVRHYVYQDETNPVAQIPGSRSARKRQQQNQQTSGGGNSPTTTTAVQMDPAGAAVPPAPPPPPPEWGVAPPSSSGSPTHQPQDQSPQSHPSPETMGVVYSPPPYSTVAGGEEATDWGAPWPTDNFSTPDTDDPLQHIPNETPTSADTLFAQMPLHLHHLVDAGGMPPL